MLSLSTIRRRAERVGYYVEKGFVRFQGKVHYNLEGERETGFMVKDLHYNIYVGGFNDPWSYTWDLEDVVELLKNEYEARDMAW